MEFSSGVVMNPATQRRVGPEVVVVTVTTAFCVADIAGPEEDRSSASEHEQRQAHDRRENGPLYENVGEFPHPHPLLVLGSWRRIVRRWMEL